MGHPRRRRGVRAAVLATVVAALLAGCAASASAEPTPRPVTAEEAQLLAVTRFDNFDAGSRPFRTSLSEQGTALELQGWIDYASSLGYAAVTGSFDPQALVWTSTTVGITTSEPDSDGNPALPIPALDDPAWAMHELDPTAARLDALLIALGGLGSDRPDNPLLVQQTGAFWLGTDDVDGTAVTIFAAPPSDEPPGPSSPPITADTSPLRLWVDADGLMLRVEVRLGDEWITVDMPDESAPVLTAAGT